MAYAHCIARLKQAAGRALSDAEVANIYERIHKAALDIKAGRATGPKPTGMGGAVDNVVEQAARQAAIDLQAEAALRQRQAHLQVTKLAARIRDVDDMTQAGLSHLDAVEKTIARDYSGRVNVESLEQRVTGAKSYYGRKLLDTWGALGKDWLGFFQSREKLNLLIRELRGESTGDALAAKGAKAFHDVAEEARQAFNAAGGEVGKLDDWGMPQHHSQYKVASAGRDAWVNSVLPMLDRGRYTDANGVPLPDADVKAFLGKAWDTIATNGHAKDDTGAFKGPGKKANRHAEARQIHFKDADAVLAYWDTFGERSAVEVLMGHIDVMARDVAMIEHFGPNPDLTYRTLRDSAVKAATIANPVKTDQFEARARTLDSLYDYSTGRTTPTYRRWLSGLFDGIANINVAAKLGGAVWASVFGDKPMMEAVAHLNNLPEIQRWRSELALLNPLNKSDRRLLQQQGLMLDGIRSGLLRFGDDLGQAQFTGKLANAVMRMTGMSAINDIRKGSFGLSLMSAIGNEIKAGVDFAKLPDSDIRTLRNYGITENDWRVWKISKLDNLGGGNDAVLTPESISRITEAELKAAGAIGQADGADEAARVKRDAIVKLLGAVNTESEFAIVTPGWKERAQFYANLQRGTVKGEIGRSVLQFKSFPWAQFQRGMDAVANSEGPVGKASMTAYLLTATTLAGAMLIQTREMMSGKDPRDMTELKFWGAAFMAGGALGIYGDFFYSINETRFGSGPLEALSGPTVGPLLEMGLVQPLNAAKKASEGKETHLLAQTAQDLKGFVPGTNVWYAKAALEHLVWQQALEWLSPGYLASMRSRTQKDYGQDWWWTPGETSPYRGPDLDAAVGK